MLSGGDVRCCGRLQRGCIEDGKSSAGRPPQTPALLLFWETLLSAHRAIWEVGRRGWMQTRMVWLILSARTSAAATVREPVHATRT